MTYAPGEVYVLPRDIHPDGDPKDRRHVLLTAGDAGSLCATAAYASTKTLMASNHACYCLVDPFATRYSGTGFNEPTYVYLSRLVAVNPSDLDNRVGLLIDHMESIRRLLRRSLGIGCGTFESGPAVGSVRGRIVELQHRYSDLSDTHLGVIVTERTYGDRQLWQHIIPIYDATKYSAEKNDVEVERADWAAHLGFDKAVLGVPSIMSVFHPRDISRPLPCGVDLGTMAAIDEAMTQHFSL